jgi:hypothetical protein
MCSAIAWKCARAASQMHRIEAQYFQSAQDFIEDLSILVIDM